MTDEQPTSSSDLGIFLAVAACFIVSEALSSFLPLAAARGLGFFIGVVACYLFFKSPRRAKFTTWVLLGAAVGVVMTLLTILYQYLKT
jgi:ABC-type Fe3+-siderophore transport system permease subunit